MQLAIPVSRPAHKRFYCRRPARLKILQVHNYYQQPGGEDQVYLAECELLEQHGDSVEQYALHNEAINRTPAVKAAFETIWNANSYRAVRKFIHRYRPDVLHCHNTFPIVSPAVYYAAAADRVPVVQTVQNYRLICPAATLLRDGRTCEVCVGRLFAAPGVLHACYRGSRSASAALAAMLTLHRLAGTWHDKVHVYLTPTNFVKSKLCQGGLPAERILVKPNFLPSDPGLGPGDGGYALFVGRLSPEKGLTTLLRCWRRVPEFPLKIAGSGPMLDNVRSQARDLPHVSVLGFQERIEVLDLMKKAAFLVVPSEWYEGFPMTVVEAMGCGTPVVASDLGSLREVVVEGMVGARFKPGDADDLFSQVMRFLSQPQQLLSMRPKIHAWFQANYSAECNYVQLRHVYDQAITNYRHCR
jgi:glycosyltransferase involved in cell wall biosynthesis